MVTISENENSNFETQDRMKEESESLIYGPLPFWCCAILGGYFKDGTSLVS